MMAPLIMRSTVAVLALASAVTVSVHMLVDYSFLVIGREDRSVLRAAGAHIKHI